MVENIETADLQLGKEETANVKIMVLEIENVGT